jgi:deoxyribonuclease V
VRVRDLHPWDLAPAEAIAVQRQLAGRVVRRGAVPERRVRLVAGADVAFDRASRRGVGAVVVLHWPSLDVVERVVVEAGVTFPYLPGLLSFRETPVLLDAFARLKHTPDLVMADGHGLAHPRRFGFACHLGMLLDVPALGVAKSRLIGTARRPGARRGSRAPLVDRGETVGMLVRTKDRVRPLYVSVGHRIALESAVRWTLACAGRHRLPEPARLADALSREAKRRMLEATVEMVVEQRAGERGRWEWLEDEGEVVFRHDLEPMPVHYGAVPRVVNPADGELLDVMLVDPASPARGEHLSVRVIDVLERGDGDHKLLAVPLAGQPPLDGVRDRIWRWYVALGRPVVRWGGEDAALALLRRLRDAAP